MDIRQQTMNLIDDLKAVCHNNGLGNDGNEYKVIVQVFLYKFLNDKFGYEIKKKNPKIAAAEKWDEAYAAMPEDDRQDLLDSLSPDVLRLNPEHLISFLWNQQAKGDFDVLFDSTMVDIADKNIDIFSTQTANNTKIPLFEKLTVFVTDDSKRVQFARALVDKLAKFSFEESFGESYDFFSTVFEYLIKDYNINGGGVYAEYYTPHAIAVIMAKLLVGNDTDLHNIECYDPAAGTGTLLMAIGHQVGEDKCTIFAQDRSQKSNKMLKLNLILNGLVSSLDHAIQGDTLIDPYHMSDDGTNLRQFDYVVCNPPFNLDFSEDRESIAAQRTRFWAGVPNVPKKDKKSMAIYTCFIQHVINSMKIGGKAAIVVPTPFLTKGKGIECKLREYMVNNRMLRGVITMPMNVFSNTGTKVSVIFLEKKQSVDNTVFLLEASGMGHKESETGRNQKTILSSEDQEYIIDVFIHRKELDGLSVKVKYEDFKNNEYRFAPTSYFTRELLYNQRNSNDLANYISSCLSKACVRYSEEIEEVINALFNSWFVQFDFISNGKPYKSSGGAMKYSEELDLDIPQDWEVKNIQSICQVIDCLHSKKPANRFEDEQYFLLQLENILEDGRIDVSSKYYVSKADYEIWTKKIEVCEGDFVVTNAGRTGAIGIVPHGIRCGIGRNMTAIRPIEVPSFYMSLFLKSPYMQKFVASNLDESSFFKSFNVRSIRKINVLVPSQNVLDKFGEIVWPLMQELLNGIPIKGEMFEAVNRLSGLVAR